jgi:hypothetical protein
VNYPLFGVICPGSATYPNTFQPKSYPHFSRARFVCDYILIELQRLSALIALIIIGCEIIRIEGVEIAAPQPAGKRDLRAVDRSDPA